MQRRTAFLALASAGAIAAVGGGYRWLTKDRDHSALALDLTLNDLGALNADSVETTGAWDVARTFNHLAQSVEFSLSGFPEPKSALFQSTVGRLAFNVFQAQGHMNHGLDEEIPGEVITAATPKAAKARLLTALTAFDASSDRLMPHFAYGALSKDEYARAHVMHINNHLEEFRGV